MGKKKDEIPAPTEPPEQVFEILEENFEAVCIFGRMTTQWNVDFNGSRIGLRYEALKIVMELTGVENEKQCFGKIRVMEKAALGLMG